MTIVNRAGGAFASINYDEEEQTMLEGRSDNRASAVLSCIGRGNPSPAVRGRLATALLATATAGLAICTPVAGAPVAAPTGFAAAAPHPAARQPNILIIVADDLGYQDVGFNGATMATPNIDRIARSGMVLDHFYTSALCSPSRAGLLTGRYPHRFGIMGDTITPGSDFGLDPKEHTIAQVLALAGYQRRSFIGKWHLGHRSTAYHPMSFGFTSYYGHYNGAIDYFTHKREGEVDWHRDRTPSADQGYSTDLMSAEAERIIRTPSPGKRPWMMWLAYNAPHGPLQATEEDLKAAGFDPAKPRFASHESAREGQGFGSRGHGNTRRQTALAMIHGMDRGIGKVLDALAQTGQLENTLILFTSDNGGPGHTGARDNASSNGSLRGWKFLHYDGGVRVAAALAWPAYLRPRTTAGIGPVSYVDILPTLAHLAGASLNRPVDGQDMSASLLTGRRPPGERSLFIGEDYSVPAAEGERGPSDAESLRGRAAAAINGRWKLVGDQLFDLDLDPGERHDVAIQHAEVVARVSKWVGQEAALRSVARTRMNATHLPPLPLWEVAQSPK